LEGDVFTRLRNATEHVVGNNAGIPAEVGFFGFLGEGNSRGCQQSGQNGGFQILSPCF